MAAIYLAIENKIDSPIIIDALKSEDNRVRGIAIGAADNFGKKYQDILLNIAQNDKYFMNRITATDALRRAHVNDKIINGLFGYAVENEKDYVVMSNLINSVWIGKYQSVAERFDEYIHKKLDSESINLRFSSANTIFTFSEPAKVIGAFEKILQRGDVRTVSTLIKRILSSKGALMGNSSSDPEVIKFVSKIAFSNENIRKIIIGEMSRKISKKSRIPEGFMHIVKHVSDKGYGLERAYSIYCMGIAKGYDYLIKNYKISMDGSNSTELNLALFLAKANSDERKTLKEAFSIRDNKLNLVEAVEINKIIKSNEFGRNFLSLCLKELRMWL